jgi:serine protease DegS
MGLVIAGVASGGPAARAGLLVGDVLLGVAGEPVEDAASLRGALAKAGDPVCLRVMRGGEVREIEAGFGGSGHARARGA